MAETPKETTLDHRFSGGSGYYADSDEPPDPETIFHGLCGRCDAVHGSWEACDATRAFQGDIAAILMSLGLGDHARPMSPHRVVRDEIIPAIEALLARR